MVYFSSSFNPLFYFMPIFPKRKDSLIIIWSWFYYIPWYNYTHDGTLHERICCCCYIVVVLTSIYSKIPRIYYYNGRKLLFFTRIRYYQMVKQIFIDLQKITCYRLWSKIANKRSIFSAEICSRTFKTIL